MSAHRVGLANMSNLPAPEPCPSELVPLLFAPTPQPGQPVLNLSVTTWGADGPETRRSRTASATFVPVLGYPDPNPFEAFRLFGRWHR